MSDNIENQLTNRLGGSGYGFGNVYGYGLRYGPCFIVGFNKRYLKPRYNGTDYCNSGVYGYGAYGYGILVMNESDELRRS